MATLHVRDVPDELYGALRERAGANDRSIGAETIQLLQDRLGPSRGPRAMGGGDPMPNRPLFAPRRRRSIKPGRFERFTPQARQVVDDAREHARSLGHGQVGAEHLLLGVLCGEADAPAVRVLHRSGVVRERVEAELERLRGRGDVRRGANVPLAPEAKRVLEHAFQEALRLRDERIAPEHILLAIIGEGGGVGAGIVGVVEPDLSKLRASVLRARRRPGHSHPLPARFCVIELGGDADGWEAQLNHAAARGYELIAIVDGRAILKFA